MKNLVLELQELTNKRNPFKTDKPKLIMLIGIPASGKSTFKRKVLNIEKELVAVCPDDIREMLSGDVSNQDYNKLVFEIVHTSIQNAIIDGKSVLLDATNVRKKYRKQYIEKYKNVAEICGIVFHVSLQEAKARIKRDLENGVNRSNVPDYVVDDMFDGLIKGYPIETSINLLYEYNKEYAPMIKQMI